MGVGTFFALQDFLTILTIKNAAKHDTPALCTNAIPPFFQFWCKNINDVESHNPARKLRFFSSNFSTQHNPPPVTQENEVIQPHKNTQQSWWIGCLPFFSFLFWEKNYVHSFNIYIRHLVSYTWGLTCL